MKWLTFTAPATLVAGLFLSFLVPTEAPLPSLSFHFKIATPALRLNDVIQAASRKHGISAAFIKSIMAAESGFSPTVVSPKGAIGLMQLMPDTAREYGADPRIPEQNVDAGAHYLSWLLNRYKGKRDSLQHAIAAYNAGPGNVARYHGIPPFRETRAYVARVLRFMKRYQSEGMDG
jgi:soluble lytic murein transglycosylase-like protein